MKKGVIKITTQTNKGKAYLFGPMAGLPDWNYPAFHDAADRWREAGWVVVNPAENFDGRTALGRIVYLRKALEQLADPDLTAGIALPRWDTPGHFSIVEAMILRGLGRPIYDADDYASTFPVFIEVGDYVKPAFINGKVQSTLGEGSSIFKEALLQIDGGRQKDYGSPERCFDQIAKVWSAIVGGTVTAEQAALCMAGMKLVRAANKPDHRDSYVDLAGYTKIAARLAEVDRT